MKPAKKEARRARRKLAQASVTKLHIASDTTSKRLKITPSMVSRMEEGPRRASGMPMNIFEPAKPPPGVVPEGVTMAMDDAWSAVTSYGYQGVNWQSDIVGWMGFPYLAELSQRPEYRRICEMPAVQMTRKWIKITAEGDDDKKADIEKIEKAFERLAVRQVFRKAALYDNLFGRAQIYIDLGKADSANENAVPLIIDERKIPIGGLKGLKVLEPLWTYPAEYGTQNPLSPDWYKPSSWYVMTRKVHASRVLTLISREVPDMLKPAYSFAGVALSQMVKPYVDNWLRTRQSVSDLVHTFSLISLATDMMANLAPGAGDGDIFQRIALFNATRDNQGLMLIQKEMEELSSQAVPLSTLDILQGQALEQMAFPSGTPIDILFGSTPHGLNASSEGQIRISNDWIGALQDHLFRAPLQTVLEIVQLSELGHIDPAIGFHFHPLWEMDEVQKATVRKVDIDGHVEAINAGMIDPEEGRQAMAASEDSLYHAVDLSGPAPGPPIDPAQDPEIINPQKGD